MQKGTNYRVWNYKATVPTPACDIAFCVGEFDVIQGMFTMCIEGRHRGGAEYGEEATR
jgi:hypothetical protein